MRLGGLAPLPPNPRSRPPFLVHSSSNGRAIRPLFLLCGEWGGPQMDDSVKEADTFARKPIYEQIPETGLH